MPKKDVTPLFTTPKILFIILIIEPITYTEHHPLAIGKPQTIALKQFASVINLPHAITTEQSAPSPHRISHLPAREQAHPKLVTRDWDTCSSSTTRSPTQVMLPTYLPIYSSSGGFSILISLINLPIPEWFEPAFNNTCHWGSLSSYSVIHDHDFGHLNIKQKRPIQTPRVIGNSIVFDRVFMTLSAYGTLMSSAN